MEAEVEDRYGVRSGAEEGVEGWLAGVRLQKAVNRREDGDMYRAGSYYESGCTGTCLRRKKRGRSVAVVTAREAVVGAVACACLLRSYLISGHKTLRIRLEGHSSHVYSRSLIITDLPFVQSFRVSHPIFNRGNETAYKHDVGIIFI